MDTATDKQSKGEDNLCDDTVAGDAEEGWKLV